MLYRSCDTSLPILEIGSIIFLRSICKCELHNTSECTFPAHHTFVVVWSHDLVPPPSRCHLCSQNVLCTALAFECIRNVVCERKFCLAGVGEARLQDFRTDEFAVYINVIYT